MSWEEVDILLVDAEVQLRQGLRNILMQEGFRGVRDISTLAATRESIRKTPPDLIVVDCNMPDGDAIGMVEDIRHKRLGSNPFVTIMLTVWSPNREIVERITKCGVDDLMVKPISPMQLMERIKFLADSRKPFIVTSEYIGPDRRGDRTGDDDEGEPVPVVEVPNTLKSKSKGEDVDYVDLQNMVENAMFEINDQRLKRHSYLIASIVDEIVPAYRENKVTQDVQRQVIKLSGVAKEISERLIESDFKHVTDLCDTLDEITTAIRNRPRDPDPRDIDLLKTLSDAIMVSFNPDQSTAEFAAEVTEMVRQQYIKRKGGDASTASTP